ncbi:acetyl-CoA carboxylase [Novibacillus thermophilus]|jgi:acetyl-CoA carboxylase biotin carboxyl carrier protein|uniref:Biotin carboxyl carrier protein of acetyl-CoA carboxylase n=1 Tax=Novibacillus thermophilus TaxID=1471761 RepID=A0A1U9K7K1_9BACL|nr:acetyl-CoA carboxylase [Novibacillus thermophilus]AQS56000.1 acetyl-CoA carboxylase biotin carboxyl carrier protein subunit [Novibacillus thermophilus]
MSDKKQVLSPLPGIFYRKPDPNADPYVKEGDRVKAGDVIGLVEVMKNFQEIQVEEDGIIESFEVENEAEVTAGQVIAVLK